MSYTIAVLLTLMRFAWLWPWMLLLKSFLSPSYPGNLVHPVMLVAVPLLSLATVRWASLTPSAGVPDPRNKLPAEQPLLLAWRTRFIAALVGLAAILGVAWWQYYRPLYTLWDQQWLYEFGYALTHWGTEEVPPQAVTLLVLIILWLNGLGDAVRGFTHDDIWGALVRNVVAMVLFMLIMSVAQRPLPAEIFYLVILLFGAGMLALAFSSLKITIGLDRALGMGQRRISAMPTMNRYWLSTVFLTVMGLLAAGIVVGILLAPEQLRRLLDAVGAVISWIGNLLGMVLLAISYVAFMVIYFVFKLFEPLIQRLMERMADSPLADLLAAPERMEQMQEVAEGTAPLPESYRWIGLAIGIGLVILLFALALRRLQREEATEEDEIRESILTVDLLQDQLSSLWRRWFGRNRSAHDPFLSLEGESDARRRVRAIYQQLLAGAASLGQARTPAETPGEYAQHLEQSWQTKEQALATITAAYHQARYAPDEPDVKQADAVNAAWHRLAHYFSEENEHENPPKESE
ncbi:MAG TPA: DUF4129 domain-containing protein [Caldilineaceae bacterium]|nr:DUF4129 domain-containing protein [Caldilineaceae bacterium]